MLKRRASSEQSNQWNYFNIFLKSSTGNFNIYKTFVILNTYSVLTSAVRHFCQCFCEKVHKIITSFFVRNIFNSTFLLLLLCLPSITKGYDYDLHHLTFLCHIKVFFSDRRDYSQTTVCISFDRRYMLLF